MTKDSIEYEKLETVRDRATGVKEVLVVEKESISTTNEAIEE